MRTQDVALVLGALIVSAAAVPAPVPAPVPITGCGAKESFDKSCSTTCGNMAVFECEAANWVFCNNAACDPEPVVYKNKSVAKCHCWRQSDVANAPPTNMADLLQVNGLTKISLLPVAENSGANCVLGDSKGGQEMCTKMQLGGLWSTANQATGRLYPGRPMKAAECPAHTPFAFCWGAPCWLDTTPGANTPVYCYCPMMTSEPNVSQELSLAGPDYCPPKDQNPCDGTQIHPNMPAGHSAPKPADITCYKAPASVDPCAPQRLYSEVDSGDQPRGMNLIPVLGAGAVLGVALLLAVRIGFKMGRRVPADILDILDDDESKVHLSSVG